MLCGLRFGLVGLKYVVWLEVWFGRLKHVVWLEVWFGRVKVCCMA